MRRFGPPPPDGGPRLQRFDPTGPRSGRPTLPGPTTEIIKTPAGVRLEQLITGTGEPTTLVVNFLQFVGAGWKTPADAMLANTSAAMAREHQQAAHEALLAMAA